jgi:hypothetical protein
MQKGALAGSPVSCSLIPGRIAWAALALLAAAVVVSSVEYAVAESLQMKGLKEREQCFLNDSAKSTREYCHANFVTKYDWTGAQEADLKKYNISAYCDPALWGLSRVCHDETGKGAVQAPA